MTTTTIGTLAVRRSILINATPERVWQEFETFERLREWFGRGHRLLEYEPRVGGNGSWKSTTKARRFGTAAGLSSTTHRPSSPSRTTGSRTTVG